MRCLVDGQHKLVLNLLSHRRAVRPRSRPRRGDEPDRRRRLTRRSGTRCTTDLLDWQNEKRDPFRGPVWERRPWRETRRLQWRGQFRPRPADGYAPEVRDYDTGLPTQGVKVEHQDRAR